MPAAKPKSLSKRHDTKEEKAAREVAEEGMKPVTKISAEPPARLRGHEHASSLWVEIVGLYFETEDEIITAFDKQLLTRYCLLDEECLNLEELRDGILDEHDKVQQKLKNTKVTVKNFEEYGAMLEQKNALLARYQGFDARLNTNRKFLTEMEEKLYLTPRSRAGVAPKDKDKPKPKSGMGELLDS